jgi:hypothetical protein
VQPPPYPQYQGYVQQPPLAPASPPPGAHRSPDGRYWWDGAQWQPLAAARPYASAAPRALAATLLIAAVAVSALLVIILDLIDISVLTPATAGATLSAADKDGLALRAVAAALVYYLAYIPAVVLFCVWINRACRNGAALGASGLRYTPRWAVGWWFIPFANLVQPLRVVNEIWRASEPTVGSTDDAARSRMPLHTLLPIWWATWIGGNLIGNLASQISLRSHTSGGDLAAAYLDLAAFAVNIAAGIMVILVIRAITERQERKHTRILSGEVV